MKLKSNDESVSGATGNDQNKLERRCSPRWKTKLCLQEAEPEVLHLAEVSSFSKVGSDKVE